MMDKIFKQMRRGISLGICITVFGGVAFAVDLPSRAGASEEMQILQNRLNQNLQEVALRQEKPSAAYLALARPYSEYLLHQQDFGYPRYTAYLERMRRERRAILQRLAFLKSAGSSQERPLSYLACQMPPRVFEVYSGAPMLSFYNGSYLDTKAALKPSADRVRIFG